MKKLITYSLFFVLAASFASCASTDSNGRKRCRGNGSWYNNRNTSITPMDIEKSTCQMDAVWVIE